jgi:polysaccharide export outer membrane protein
MNRLKTHIFCVSFAILMSINIYSQNSVNNIPPKIKQELEQMYSQKQKFELNPQITELGNNREPIEKLINPQDSFQDDSIPKVNDSDDSPKRFGQSFFNQEISTFAPVDNVNVPDDYVIGIGDSLVIQLMGTTNERFELPLDRDGSIFIESLGVMNLSGLTINQVIQLLEKKVSNELFGATVSVTLGKLKDINIFLTGEVKNPGMYSVSSLTTITQALYQSGGITNLGSIRNINVLRNGSIAKTFDAYDLLINGDSSGDIRLRSGDVILVPPYQSIVEVKGGSKRPMLYEISSGETLADLLRISAGFSKNSIPSESFLITKRDVSSYHDTLTVDLLNKADLDIKIGIDDVLIIPVGHTEPSNSIEVVGAAYRNGRIGWKPEMYLSDLFNNLDKDFPPFIDLDFSLIVRKPDRLSNYEFINFSLRDFFKSESFEDIELFENDKILFFSDFKTQRLSIINENDLKNLIDQPDATNELSEDSFDAPKTSSRIPYNIDLQSNELSRKKLLDPIIELIKRESSQGNPVKLVSISGEVKYPGTYPLFKNSVVKDLIRAAGGLTDLAYESSIEIRRNALSSNGYNNISFEIDGSYQSQDLYTTELESLDHITVRKLRGRNENLKVLLAGEFNFPGEYIISESESLASLIERAGGFTEQAYIKGSIYLSKSSAISERKRLSEYSNQIKRIVLTSSLTQEIQSGTGINDIDKLLQLLESIQPSGRISYNFNSDNLDQIIVQDGDSITIPTKPAYVTIIGEIHNSNTINFQKTLSIEDYITMAGGLTDRADQNSIYIIKANGSTISLEKDSFRVFGRKPVIEPGDTIVVPINPQFKDALSNWVQVTQLIYQSMVSLAAVKGL